MQPKISSSDLAEFIKFGQTGVLQEPLLAAMGVMLQGFEDRLLEIVRTRNALHAAKNMKPAGRDYCVIVGVGMDEDSFVLAIDNEDFHSTDTEYVGYADFLNHQHIPNMLAETAALRASEADRVAANKLTKEQANAAVTERAERAEFARLKAKFEPTAAE